MSKIAIALLLGLAAMGCKKDGEGAAAGGGETIGVAECDEYVTKYEACIGKMPEAARAAAGDAFKQQRAAFKQAASTPEGKTAIASSCKQAMEAIKATCP